MAQSNKKKTVTYWDNKLIGGGGILNTYIKLRDAHRFENGKPVCFCITCGKEVMGHNLHAGHFISRRHKKFAYDERNIHAQCGMPCNDKRIGKGEPIKYRHKLLEMYGQEVVEELEQSVYSTGKHWTATQLEDKYLHYKKLVDNFYKDNLN